jgi:hypothetical protein
VIRHVIPSDNQLAERYSNEVKKYLEFQPTVAYLKGKHLIFPEQAIVRTKLIFNLPDLPSNYFYPAVDLLGCPGQIASKAAAGGYSS